MGINLLVKVIKFKGVKMNQDDFMKKKTKVSYILPGGRGSGKKSWPIFIENLKEKMKMKTSVTKIIKFETAHQLTDSYSKECQNIHGHSYRCEVTFEGDVDSQTGMIMDFKLIKELLQQVIDKYDHKFFDSKSFEANPTAENMCIDIFRMVRFNSILVKKVRLWETDTCYAEVSY